MSADDTLARARDLHAAGRAVEAERLYREILRAVPDHAEALQGLGVLCLQTQRIEPAVTYLGKAAALAPGSAMLYNNLGVAFTAARRFGEATETYRKSLAVEPDAVDVNVNLAAVLTALGRTEDAIGCLNAAIRRKPESLDLAMTLASTYLRAAHFEAAAEAFRAALGLQPDLAEAHCRLGEALGALDRHAEAAACFEQALKTAPEVAVVHYNYGSALTFLGRMDEATRAYETAVALAPDIPSYRYALMALKQVAANDPNLQALEAMAASAARYPAWEQAELHVALAGAYDGLGRYEQAFAHLAAGNSIKRKLVRYDEDKELAVLAKTAATFTRAFLAAHRGEGDPDPRPVFIVGMPRSGTSLVEQILASHSAVFGAGEQPILPELVGQDFPSAAYDLCALGRAYVARLQVLAPDAARIVDKLLGNFLYAGLIHLALPNARIIHVARDPLDTCLSCYSKLFSSTVNYAYDLGELGRYYRAYEALMAHWRSVLPPATLLEISYEALIADLESEARRLIAHCGLDWDPRCLDFHKTQRTVRTASAIQVRRPLYRSAVGRAKAYLPWLGPLTAALAGAL
jgi:tetratricopeptide (TPR) repeat protein